MAPIASTAAHCSILTAAPAWRSTLADAERRRARGYPISRWYLRPLAGMLARALAASRVRPWQMSLCGLAAAGLAAALLIFWPVWSPLAAALVLLAWFFDRADGQLARLQQTASATGAWLDANIDELIDLGLHAAVAAAAAASGSIWAWPLLIAFLTGKYLLMYGLLLEDALAERPASEAASPAAGSLWDFVRQSYHLPGNADVRVHLLAVALLGGWFTAELAIVAGYYNLRWIARYGLLVARGRRGAAL